MRNHVFLGVILLVLLVFLCACDRETVGSDSGTFPCANSTSETEPASETDPPVSVSPASDFLYEEDGDGITILEYKGEDKNVVIPAMIEGKPVTAIGQKSGEGNLFGPSEYCFDRQGRVVSVSVPDSVKALGRYAFQGSSALVRVELPDSLRILDDSAFANCVSLTSLNLPDSLVEIGDFAFMNCSSLTYVRIPANVLVIGRYAFFYSGLEAMQMKDGVSEISWYAFSHSPLKEIVLPDSVKTIGKCAFADCSALEKITLGKNLERIEEQAFAGAETLTSIVIPPSVETIWEDVFVNCFRLKNVIFKGDAPVEIHSDCTGIDPDDTFFLPDFTIFYHSGAKGFTYPSWNGYRTDITDAETDSPLKADKLMTEGDYEYRCLGNGAVLFRYHGDDSEVVIPSTLGGRPVTGIDGRAFLGNEKIVSVRMPDTITFIGKSAFFHCCQLSDVTLSSKLQSIGDNGFALAIRLKEAPLPDSLVDIGTMAFAQTALTEVRIPPLVVTLNAFTFFQAPLQSVEFAGNVETICDGTFCDTALEYIVLPASVRNITGRAFYLCPRLVKVAFEGDAPEDFHPGDPYPPSKNGMNFKVLYHEGAKGFSSPQWQGHKTELW